jgi:hypothetical protein
MSYKPGVSLSAEMEAQDDVVRITLRSRRQDARKDREDEIKIGSSAVVVLDYFKSKEDIFVTVRQLVHEFEKHEADEWLAYDGSPIYDPHFEDWI